MPMAQGLRVTGRTLPLVSIFPISGMEYVYGTRIAGDNERPPPGVNLPTQRNEVPELQPRQGAPQSISSSDGKYLLDESPCDQNKDITKYFLFASGTSRASAHLSLFS